MRTLLFFFAFVSLVFSQGRTYFIAEPDFLEEIEVQSRRAIQKLQNRQFFSEERYIPSWVATSKEVKPSQKSFTYRHRYVYTLDHDIPQVDSNGNVIGVLYPKGYSFLPLKYMPRGSLPKLLVFDPNVPWQVRYIKRNADKFKGYVYLAVGTSYKKLRETAEFLDYPVYYMPREMYRKLDIKYTISLVDWDYDTGDVIIRVIGLEEAREKASSRR